MNCQMCYYYITIITISIQLIECINFKAIKWTTNNPPISTLNLTETQLDLLGQLELQMNKCKFDEKQRNIWKTVFIKALSLIVTIIRDSTVTLLTANALSTSFLRYFKVPITPKPMISFKFFVYKQKRLLFNILFTLNIMINLSLLAYVMYQRHNMKYQFKKANTIKHSTEHNTTRKSATKYSRKKHKRQKYN